MLKQAQWDYAYNRGVFLAYVEIEKIANSLGFDPQAKYNPLYELLMKEKGEDPLYSYLTSTEHVPAAVPAAAPAAASAAVHSIPKSTTPAASTALDPKQSLLRRALGTIKSHPYASGAVGAGALGLGGLGAYLGMRD